MKKIYSLQELILMVLKQNRGKNHKLLIIATIALHDRVFPVKWEDFNAFVTEATIYLNANKVRLGILLANMTILADLINNETTGWIFVYEKTTNSLTKNKPWRDKRDVLRGKIVAIMNIIFGDIMESVYTSDDRIALRHPLHVTHSTPSTKMLVSPKLSMESIIHLQQILRLQNPETPDSAEMPDKQHIVLEYFIGLPGLAADAIHFADAKTVTTFLYGVAFEESNAGKTIYYRACYESTRGERSVWSAILSAVIA